MPKVYAPIRADASVPDGYTFCQVFTKPNGPFSLTGSDLTLQQIINKDGTARTILVAEAAHPVPWTKPADMAYAANAAVPALGHTVPTGFHAVMFDGKVYFITKNASEHSLRLWITPDDGRPAPQP